MHWPQLIVPICVLAFTLAIGYAAKRLMTRLLRPWAARATGHAAQIVIDALKGPFMIWVLILGTHLAMQSSELPYRATFMIGRILLVLWILSLTLISSRLAGDLIRFYGSDIPGALPVTTLTQTLAQLGVVILGALVLLNLLGISVTPDPDSVGRRRPGGGVGTAGYAVESVRRLLHCSGPPGSPGRLHPSEHGRGRLRHRYRLAQHHGALRWPTP